MMPRITVITLGVDILERTVRFYIRWLGIFYGRNRGLGV